MLDKTTKKVIEAGKNQGWVLEPDAKAILSRIGLDIPEGIVTDSMDQAERFFKKKNRPVVVKAVSKQILHKTEHDAVVVNIRSIEQLEQEMKRLLKLPGCENVLIEEMIRGIEVIIGAKNDYQFGPVVVLGVGGTGVEIYKDTAIRLAPLKPGDVFSMVDSLTAKEIILGHRGSEGVNMEVLTHAMVHFSYLLMDLESKIESIDLNPVMCTRDRCVVADARIILSKKV